MTCRNNLLLKFPAGPDSPVTTTQPRDPHSIRFHEIRLFRALTGIPEKLELYKIIPGVEAEHLFWKNEREDFNSSSTNIVLGTKKSGGSKTKSWNSRMFKKYEKPLVERILDALELERGKP